MSYCKYSETGYYIYPDSENVVFEETAISNKQIDIFLYRLYRFRKKEFKQRLKNGRKLIKEFERIKKDE